MSTVTRKTYDEEIQNGLQEWLTLHPDATELDKDEITAWLIKHRGYHLEKRGLHREVGKRLSRVIGKKRVKNSQGKWVSEFHAASFSVPGKKKQKTLWAPRLKMSNSFAHTAFDQRQKQAEGVCRAMHNDAEDVNANNPNLAANPIQLELDFSYVQGQSEPRKVQTLPALADVVQAPVESARKKPKPK